MLDRANNNNDVNKLFADIDFDPTYFKGHTCYAEVMLLAYALACYIVKHQTDDNENTPSVVSLLLEDKKILQPPPFGNETALDRCFAKLKASEQKNKGVAAYSMFKHSSIDKQREAIVALYEYYTIEQYL